MYSAARPAGAPFVLRVRRRRRPRRFRLAPRRRGCSAPWADDAAFPACFGCRAPFTLFNRRHHCRHCGFVFCKKCAGERAPLARLGFGAAPQRVCRGCAAAAARGGGGLRARGGERRVRRRRGGRRRAERGRVRPRSRDHDRERRVRNRRRLRESAERAPEPRRQGELRAVSKPEPTILPTREMRLLTIATYAMTSLNALTAAAAARGVSGAGSEPPGSPPTPPASTMRAARSEGPWRRTRPRAPPPPPPAPPPRPASPSRDASARR